MSDVQAGCMPKTQVPVIQLSVLTLEGQKMNAACFQYVVTFPSCGPKR